MSVLNTPTKRFMVLIALVILAWEIAAVFTSLQVITHAMAELACGRPWIPLVIGFILGHFYWPNKRLVDKIRENEARRGE